MQVSSFAVILLLTSALFAQEGAQKSNPTCRPAKVTGEDISSVFEFSTDAAKYRMQARGLGFQTLGNRSKRFHLALSKGEFLTRHLFVCQLGPDVLIVSEASDAESGFGYVFLVTESTLLSKWRQEISGFNVAQPVLSDGVAYVSGSGFIAGIDLDTGKYKWRHSNLYCSGEFNNFAPAIISDNIVLFKEPNQPLQSAIAVDRASGRILRPAYVKKRETNPGDCQ